MDLDVLEYHVKHSYINKFNANIHILNPIAFQCLFIISLALGRFRLSFHIVLIL